MGRRSSGASCWSLGARTLRRARRRIMVQHQLAVHGRRWKRYVCCVRLFAHLIYGRIACVWIDKIVWIVLLVAEFGSLIQESLDHWTKCLDHQSNRVWITEPSVWIIDPTEFGSLVQVFGSLIHVFGSLIQQSLDHWSKSLDHWSKCLDHWSNRVWITDPRVWITDPRVWIIDPTEFGSLIQEFGSLIQEFGSWYFYLMLVCWSRLWLQNVDTSRTRTSTSALTSAILGMGVG